MLDLFNERIGFRTRFVGAILACLITNAKMDSSEMAVESRPSLGIIIATFALELFSDSFSVVCVVV